MGKVMVQWGPFEFEQDDIVAEDEYFNAAKKSAWLWLEQSRSLHRAAVALVRKESMWCAAMTPRVNAPIALMLGGYAVETLLKMVIVADHCEQHGNGLEAKDAKDFLPKIHDLVDLAGKAALRINKRDRDLLKELTKFAVWAGRYPTPRSPEGYDGPAVFAHVGNWTEHPLWTAYAALYEKLHRLAVRKAFRGHPRLVKSSRKRF